MPLYIHISAAIKWLGAAFLLLLAPVLLYAQNPISNRVTAAAKALPAGTVQWPDIGMALATDCIISISTGSISTTCCPIALRDVTFSSTSYDKVISSWLSPDGNYFYIAIDRAAW